MVTLSIGSPALLAACARANSGCWKPPQISSFVPLNQAMQFTGSICACDRYGSRYVASIVLRADVSAPSASPTAWSFLNSPRCKDASMAAKIVADDVAALAPSFQTGFKASSADRARQVLSASTTTASGKVTTRSTPRALPTEAVSTLFSEPPKVGEEAIAPYSMPGNRTSAL